MTGKDFIAHSNKLSPNQSGELLHLSREEAAWKWMSFFVRRLAPNEVYRAFVPSEEAVFVILGGRCRADWGDGDRQIGKRENVFGGLPYALYLPAGNTVTFQGETMCEIAECRVPSTARREAKLVTPADTQSNLRGGGNASRQIVDVIPADFAADRLVVFEVYTPGGNWSSYPPHKHDVHNPPHEVDLDEIYYYRIAQPDGFALQQLYTADRSRDLMLRAQDGDAVLVRDGFHPVVAGPGYDCYYLNFLAGTARTMSVTEDPKHVWLRSTWKDTDPRLPLVRG
jgi:5-deoxy-glucuronate isomerase